MVYVAFCGAVAFEIIAFASALLGIYEAIPIALIGAALFLTWTYREFVAGYRPRNHLACSHCGSDDIASQYLNNMGEPDRVHRICGDCRYEWIEQQIFGPRYRYTSPQRVVRP